MLTKEEKRKIVEQFIQPINDDNGITKSATDDEFAFMLACRDVILDMIALDKI
jgi:hypothetical protein